jgi:hypothetical protein
MPAVVTAVVLNNARMSRLYHGGNPSGQAFVQRLLLTTCSTHTSVQSASDTLLVPNRQRNGLQVLLRDYTTHGARYSNLTYPSSSAARNGA